MLLAFLHIAISSDPSGGQALPVWCSFRLFVSLLPPVCIVRYESRLSLGPKSSSGFGLQEVKKLLLGGIMVSACSTSMSVALQAPDTNLQTGFV